MKIDPVTLYFNLPFENLKDFFLRNGENVEYENLKGNHRIEQSVLQLNLPLNYGIAAIYPDKESAVMARLHFGDWEFIPMTEEEYTTNWKQHVMSCTGTSFVLNSNTVITNSSLTLAQVLSATFGI